MGRHQENPVRLYFSYDPISNKSRCQIEGCLAEIAGNHGGNLQRHVQRMHPSVFATLHTSTRVEDPSTPSASAYKRPVSNMENQRTIDCLVAKQPRCEAVYITPDSLREACVELITVNGRPFSLMDDSGFRKIIDPLLEAIDKTVIINSETVRTMVSEVAERDREKLRNGLKDKLLMLKVDIASYKNRSVLGINVQYTEGEHIILLTLAVRELHEKHTDRYLSAVVREVLKMYAIDLKQVYSITIDDGGTLLDVECLVSEDSDKEAEVDGADRDEEKHAGEAGIDGNGGQASEKSNDFLMLDIYETSGNVNGELHSVGSGGPVLKGRRCSAHTFQLAVEDALKDRNTSSLIAKARHVCEKLCTPNVSGFLRRLGQTQAVTDYPNRWLSTFDMLERLCLLKTFCEDMAPTIPELYLNESEWDEINQLVWTLQPAKMTTKLLLLDQMTAGDFFGAWLKCKIETDKIGGPFSALLVECLNRHQHMLFENEAFLAAVFLDPRYKVLLTEAQVEQAKRHLCQAWGMIQTLTPNTQLAPPTHLLKKPGTSDADDEIEQMLVARERETGSEGMKCKTSVMSSLNAYASQERLKREENIFRYWLNTSIINPDLYRLAINVIPLPVTQVSVQRTVSGLRYILSLRPSMSNDALEDVLFVRLNKQFRQTVS
ncbi:uncharacterized protein LOC125750773 [Brienomyrus brachyistius]|uniref:uncharacterized protein LOC125750773 n=1 Tax=Brienomyrus brachyistius TaxID=42636 RepID=UPI0020B2B7C0|nr:uncharacterized protein LOC125750773 [Brienomyrus brachyistius]